MTTRPASELYLATDFSCSGQFSAVGALREPSLALTVALRDLHAHCDNPELRGAVVHALATRLVGRSIIPGAHVRRALADCLAQRIALEWKITIPLIGSVQAMFLITRFDETANLVNLALQLSSKPSFESAEAAEVELAPPPRRACSLLRIF